MRVEILLALVACFATGPRQQDDSAADDALPQSAPVVVPADINPNDKPVADYSQPPSVSEERQDVLESIDLRSALVIALENNRSIEIQRYMPAEAWEQVMLALSAFEPEGTLGVEWGQRDALLTSTIDVAGAQTNRQKLSSFGSEAGAPTQIGYHKPLLTGGRFSAEWSAGYLHQTPTGAFTTLNPYWNTSTNFSITQPLLERRGVEINKMPIRIAHSNWRQSKYDFLTFVDRLLLDVELAYWDLAIAYSQVEVQTSAVTHTQKVLEKELSKLELGESSRPAVGQARENYQRTRMSLLNAKNRLLEAERSFRQQLGMPGFDGYQLKVIATEQSPLLDMDWDAAVNNVLNRRPELAASQEQTRAMYGELMLAKDKTKPSVDFVGSYSLDGLGSNVGDAVKSVFDNGTYAWSMGVTFNDAINQNGACSEFRAKQLAFQRQRKVYAQLEYDLVHDLQQAYQSVINARQQALESTTLREAAADRLEAAQEFYDLGGQGIDLLLRARNTFTNAEITERDSYLRLRQAIAQWYYAQGTIRDAHHFFLPDEPDEIRPRENEEDTGEGQQNNDLPDELARFLDDSSRPLQLLRMR